VDSASSAMTRMLRGLLGRWERGLLALSPWGYGD
jgi:hypothetical protein